MTIAPVSTFTSQTRHRPYITNSQFKKAPTGVPWQSLVSGGNPREQEEQLTELIERASTWVDSICMQVLAATEDTEQGLVTLNRYGQLIISPRYQPVLQLTDFWSGGSPSFMTQVTDLSGCWVEPKRIIVSPSGVFNGPAAPLIQFGVAVNPASAPTFCRWSYVTGFPLTSLTVDVEAGADTITVDDATGIIANFTPLRIEDATGYSEELTVSSVSGNTITLASPLTYAHVASTAVTAIPADVEEAVILATTGLANIRGNGGTTVTASSRATVTEALQPFGGPDNLGKAQLILERGDYMRVYS